MKSESIDNKFMAYELSLNNALTNKPLLDGLSAYGYNESKLNEGKVILAEARNMYEQQKTDYANKYGVSDELKKVTDEAYKAYMKTVKVARVAYEDDVNSQKRLVLDESRKKTFSGWVDQAERMYKNILTNTETKKGVSNIDNESISKYGYNIEKITAEYDLIKKAKELNMKYTLNNGNSQDVTQKKDDAIKIIDKWMSSFIKIARVAFEENKQMLEQLGIVVKNTRKKKDNSEDSSDLTPLLENK